MPAGPIRFTREDESLKFGLTTSVIAHVVITLFLFFGGFSFHGEVPEPVIYSVTMEGGKQLGGKSQVPEKDEQPKAPPKAAQSVAKTEPEVEQKKDDPKKQPDVPPEDAEISLNQKPTVAPTKPPKISPTASAKKTAAPATTPKPKPTATPRVRALSKEEIDDGYESAIQRYVGESAEAGGEGFGAARADGGRGMGGGTVVSPEVLRYYEAMKQHVRKRFQWRDTQSRLSATVNFDMDSQGRLASVELFASSGNREYDLAVLRAIERSNPMPMPEADVYRQLKKPFRFTLVPADQLR